MLLLERVQFPRLPLDGSLDLTYRCNNHCRHCWLWLAPASSLAREELSFDEIRRIVDEARRLGCQAWSISGGEPMLRPDFAEIFDYITSRSVSYKLNTNATLITPAIARLLVRKGQKMLALYGASPEVHDYVTRTPGSFDAALRGFAYLKEAGAGFIVQIVPMRANYHQYGQMLELARSLSPYYRVGAPWLWLSACGSKARNREIEAQRLDPQAVIALDEPLPIAELAGAPSPLAGPIPFAELVGEPAAAPAEPLPTGELVVEPAPTGELMDPAPVGKLVVEPAKPVPSCELVEPAPAPLDDRLFAACIAARREFHIDPYGHMSFCSYIKDPALRFDLRTGSFQQAWEDFIPSLADAVRGGPEFQYNCSSCDLRPHCRWCGVFGYLEHGRYGAPVSYLCRVAEQARRFKEDWKLSHVHYYQIAGITVQVSADFPLHDRTFAPRFDKFKVHGPGDDTISIRLVSSLPALSDLRLGKEVYRHSPWAIYQGPRSWVYLGISDELGDRPPRLVSIFNQDHTHATIYHPGDISAKGELGSLTTFPTDQILLARVLADRQACYLHASGIIIDGQGLLFVGHSEAGKSTIMKMLRQHGEILCDDRIILRRWEQGFRIHGTWSHGELPDVSPASAPLRAIFFLEKSGDNLLTPIETRLERFRALLPYLIRPLVTADWWEKTLDLAERVAGEVPSYRLQFDRSGRVVDLLRQLLRKD